MQIDVGAAAAVLDELAAVSQPPRNEISAIVQRKPNIQHSREVKKANSTPPTPVPPPPPLKVPQPNIVVRNARQASHNPEKQHFRIGHVKATADVRPEETTTIAAFVDKAKSLTLLECKPVEASGTGASSVFLRSVRSDTVGKPASLTLPFKAWMTKTSICAEPYILFRVPQETIREHQRALGYLNSTPRSSPASRQPLVVATVLLEEFANGATDKEYDIRFSTTSDLDADTSVLLATATVASPKEVAHLQAPSGALSAYAKIEIKPRATSTWLVKVSGVCLWIRTGEEERSVAADEGVLCSLTVPFDKTPTQINRSADSTISSVTSITESVGSTNGNRPASVSKPTYKKTVLTSPVGNSNNKKLDAIRKPPVEQQNTGRAEGMNVSRGLRQIFPSSAEQTEGTRLSGSIAEEMRQKAAFLLERFPEMSRRESLKQTEGERPNNSRRREYDWLHDESRSVVSSKGSNFNDESTVSAPTCRKKKSQYRDTQTTYAQLVEAWEVAPKHSLAQVLTMCMEETTAFSYSIAERGDVRGMLGALSSSFSLNLLRLEVQPTPSTARESVLSSQTSSALDDLVRMLTLCDSMGYSMQLVSRLPNGFCVSTAGQQRFFGESTAAKKYTIVVVERDTEQNYALGQSARVFFSEPSKQLAALCVVLDLTKSFSATLPALSDWSKVRDVHYYGAEDQSELTMFLSKSCCCRQTNDDGEPSASLKTRSICYNGFRLSASQIPVETATDHTEIFLSVTLRHCMTSFRVWQPQHSCPRVVLTNSHFLENLRFLDGGLASREMIRLGRVLFNSPTYMDHEIDTKVLTNSEEPWEELARKGRSGNQEEDTNTWFEYRRQITSKFVFHALSTAYRRDWRTVGICLPYICCSEESSPLALSHGFLDQDSLMDTVLRWSFPCPTSVVFFYGHSQPSTQQEVDSEERFPPFTREAVSCFVCAESLAAALE